MQYGRYANPTPISAGCPTFTLLLALTWGLRNILAEPLFVSSFLPFEFDSRIPIPRCAYSESCSTNDT